MNERECWVELLNRKPTAEYAFDKHEFVYSLMEIEPWLLEIYEFVGKILPPITYENISIMEESNNV